MKLMVAAAFPQELKHILKNTGVIKKSKRSAFTIYESQYLSHELTAVQTGMGPFSEAALGELIGEYGPDYLVSIGFGGALYEGARRGELVWGERVELAGADKREGFNAGDKKIFKKLGEKLDIKEGVIITIGRPTPKWKLRKTIANHAHFPVCDMETFYMERLARKHGVPFFAIRSITDRIGEEIPEEFFGVCDESGGYSVARALRILAMKPGLIPASIRLGAVSAAASKNLFRAFKALVEALTSG